jgi:hypothetical protein
VFVRCMHTKIKTTSIQEYCKIRVEPRRAYIIEDFSINTNLLEMFCILTDLEKKECWL